ncbi:MAG: sterol desaturase family protein [Pyrinomonadaceae bacterium]
MNFLILTIIGFAAMEAFSYFIHRFLFHGILWKIHITHHTPRRLPFELNDIFSIIFAAVSICLMIFAERPLINSISFPVGFGIALYGVFYFIIHDLFTHRRFLPFSSKNKVFVTVRAAHQRHHQTAEKKGIEPFGLFAFDYGKFRGKMNRKAKPRALRKSLAEIKR